MINQQSPVPLYRQLSGTIEDKINSGEYPPQSKIPSENELVKMYSIGRPTVRQALDFLVRQGLLEKQKGRGTFVLEKTDAVDLFSLAGTSAAFHAKGISVEQRLLETPQIILVPSDTKHAFSGKECLFLTRIFYVKKNPILIDELWIDHHIFPGIENTDFSGASLSAIIKQRYYMSPDECTQTFCLDIPTAAFRKKLQIEQDNPVLLVKRILGFREHQNAIFSHLWCRTDQYQFSQNIRGNYGT